MTLGVNSLVRAFLAVGGCTSIFNSHVLTEDRMTTVSAHTIQSTWESGHAYMCDLITPFPTWLWDWSLYKFFSVLIFCCNEEKPCMFVSIEYNPRQKKVVTTAIMPLMLFKVIEHKSLKTLKNMVSVSSYKLWPITSHITNLLCEKLQVCHYVWLIV